MLAWQGANAGRGGLVLDPLRPLGGGVYRTTEPVPVYGKWKAILRLATGNSVQAVPIFLPADPAITAPEVPAHNRFTRSFAADKSILKREFLGGSAVLLNGGYAVLGMLGALWIASLAWGLSRLNSAAGRRKARDPGLGKARAAA